MKNKLFKGICLTLALSLLASCGGTGTQSGGNFSNPVITDPNSVERKDWKEKYDPAIDLVTVRSDLPYVPFENGDNMDNNVWYRMYKDELGINVKNLWVADSSSYGQKVDLMLSSGELPDVFQVNAQQLQTLLESDMIEDLSEAWLAYASDDTKTLVTEAGPYAIDAATFDGRLMALPFTGNQLEGIMLYWLRTDWLEKLGLSYPKTQQELEDVMIAYAKNDPDGNGKADTFCLNLSKDSFGPNGDTNNAFFNAYDAWNTIWIEKNGKLEWGGIQPEIKNALKALNRLYKEGAINKEFTTIDSSKANEALVNDKVGMIYSSDYGSATLKSMVAATGKEDVWQAYKIPSATGNKVLLSCDTTTYGFHVVRKGYKYPEAAVKLMNSWVQEFYMNGTDRERYLHLIQNDVGTNPKWCLAMNQAYRPINNTNNYRMLEKMVQTGDKSWYDKVTIMGKVSYEGGLRYRDKGEKSQWFWWVMHCPEYKNPSMKLTSENLADNAVKFNAFYGTMTPAMQEKWGLLWQKQGQYYQEIITGARPLDDFDTFIKEWKELGGEQVTTEVNAWYADHKDASKNIFAQK